MSKLFTDEQIMKKISDIYREHPYLENRVLTSDCKCCEHLDIADEHGWEAARAWEEVEMWKWLLNE